MAFNFQSISVKNIARGLDLRSVENSLPPGYSERLRNVVTSSSGHISKRKGYQGYAGNLPFRVQSVSKTGTKITLSLDGAVNTLAIQSTPIVVYGKLGKPTLGSPAGDLQTTNTLKYYPTFTTNIPDTIAANPAPPAVSPTVTLFQSGRYNAVYGNPLFTTRINTAPGINNSWEGVLFGWDVNQAASYDIDLNTNLPTTSEVFLYANDYEGIGGTSYATTYTNGVKANPAAYTQHSWATDGTITVGASHTLVLNDTVVFDSAAALPAELVAGQEYFVVAVPGATTYRLSATRGGSVITFAASSGLVSATLDTRGTEFTIFAATHQLSTFKIIPQVFVADGAEWQAVLPQDLTVNLANGTVQFRILNAASSTNSAKILLVSVPDDDSVLQGSSVSNYTVTLDSDFPHVAQFDSSDGTTYNLTIPNTLTYNDVTGIMSVTNSVSGQWLTNLTYSSVQSNALVLEDQTNTSESYTDASPQLTVWGFDHAGIYNSDLYGGHVTHIDSYRSVGTSELVSGLGGNLFKALSYANGFSTYGYASSDVSIQNRVAGNPKIGPVFKTRVNIVPTTDVDLSTNTITSVNHPFTNGTRVEYQEGDGIGGLVDETIYYIVNRTEDTFQLSATLNGPVIDLTSIGGSSTTIFRHEPGRSDGAQVVSTTIDNNHYARIDSIYYNGTSGQVRYEFDIPGATFSFSTNNRLTVKNAPYDILNGTFDIVSIDGTNLHIVVSNPLITTTDFDCTGIEARGGIFTDEIQISDPQEFIPGDIVTGDTLTFNSNLVIYSSTATVIRVSNVLHVDELTPGDLLTATRTTDFVPVADVKNYVVGDMLAVDGLARQVRIIDVRASQTMNIESITFSSGTATVTTNRPHSLSSAQSVMIADTSIAAYNGYRTITRTGETTFTFSTTGSPPNINLVGRVHIPCTSITVSGTTATANFSANHRLAVGDKCLLVGGSGHDRLVTVTSVPSVTSVQFVTSATTAYSPTLTAGTNIAFLRGGIQLDESLDISDASLNPTTFTVADRWIPIEIPVTADTLPAKAVGRHFAQQAYDNQTILRSTTVSDNMYLTNQDDEVYKYDGTNLYHAGLPKWQAQLFTSIDTDTAAIPEDVRHAFTAKTDNAQALTMSESTTQFSVGDIVYKDGDTAKFTITAVDNVNKILYLAGNEGAVFTSVFTSGTGNIRKAQRFGYYFRLNAVDANNNVLSSAVVGDADYVVDFVGTGTIEHRLVGLPTFGYLDYDRIELQCFRTKANAPGVYYLVQQRDIDFNNVSGYIDIQDGVNDEQLVTPDFLSINTANPPFISGEGTELGRTWTLPPRAKYITSLGNRLVLGNIKDYSSQEIVLRKKATKAEFAAADLDGKTLIVRKDATVTSGTAGNMFDRITVEYESSATTITPASDIDVSVANLVTITVSNTTAVGDWVYLFHGTSALNRRLRFSGWHQITARTSSTVTVSYAHDGVASSSADVDRVVLASVSGNIPVFVGTDYNYRYFGAQDLDETDIQIRTANAINACQRQVNTSITGFSSFAPWVLAYAGSEYGIGVLQLRQEHPSTTNFGITTPTSVVDSAEYYVNGLLRGLNTTVISQRKLFPSRVVISYENYPEIFDNPYADQFDSDSVIDINSADGQEITGIIPFFGESVFGQGTVEDILVVFKTNSVYLVNINTRQVSKIQSRGLGCTAPFSIANTRDGIMFANDSGIYRLNRDQSISYVGKFVERYWQDNVNKSDMSRVQGHHYAIGNQYKLSIPTTTAATINDSVLVYDHQLEGQEQEFGAWTEHTNHPVTGWANLVRDAYFGATTGRVFVIRNTGLKYDYRDDSVAVTSDCILRAMDLDQSGIRKIISSVVSHLQLRTGSQTGTQLLSSVDLNGVFEDCGTIVATKDTTKKLVSVRSAIPRRKQVYLQLQYVNAVKDEEFILAGVDLYATALTNKGILEQAEST